MSIVGIDEVGRGPLAGPLVVGAVIFKDEKSSAEWITQLKDSKKLSAKKREQIAITADQHVYFALGWVSSSELDQIGITRALELAATRAIVELASVCPNISQIVIDGNLNFLKNTKFSPKVTTLIKADAEIKQVSAASILAKVARDRYMMKLAEKYPTYGFEKHMGYGTASHLLVLREFGPCPEHRFSYTPVRLAAENLKKSSSTNVIKNTASNLALSPLKSSQTPQKPSSISIVLEESQKTTAIGRAAESLVADHLSYLGHHILARNFRTKSYEIDIISQYDNCLYFTEVRCRSSKSKAHITPLDTISHKKRQQIIFAAENFIQTFNYSTLSSKSQADPEIQLENQLNPENQPKNQLNCKNIANFRLAIAEVYHDKDRFWLNRWLPLS